MTRVRRTCSRSLTRACAIGGVLTAATAAMAGCGGGGGDSTGPDPQPKRGNAVSVSNNAFTPASLSVTAGGSVTWTWNSCSGGDVYGGGQTCVSHNVTFDQGPSSATQSSGTFVRAFPTAGTYDYHCTIHGAAMSGRVVVR